MSQAERQAGKDRENLANLWTTYRFASGTLKNLGIGAGGNYASRYKVIDNSKTGVFYLPSYALLNAGVFYNAKHFRVSFNVNNIITNTVSLHWLLVRKPAKTAELRGQCCIQILM